MPDESTGFEPETAPPLVMPADEFAAVKAVNTAWETAAGSRLAETHVLVSREDLAWVIDALDRVVTTDAMDARVRLKSTLLRAQDSPGAPDGPEPVSQGPGDDSSALRAAPETIPLFDLPPEGTPQ